MAETCPYTPVQTHRRYHTKSEPSRELWTLRDYVVAVWVHGWRSVSPSGGDVEMGEAMPVCGKSWYLPLHLAMNLKLFYKNKAFNKNKIK